MNIGQSHYMCIIPLLLERYTSLIISLFVCSYTIVDYNLEQYFSLTLNQPAVNNLRSFTTKRTSCMLDVYPTFTLWLLSLSPLHMVTSVPASLYTLPRTTMEQRSWDVRNDNHRLGMISDFFLVVIFRISWQLRYVLSLF